MKKQEQPELSYYGLYLLRYLLEQHSRKAKDLSFIYSREQLAAETFEQARLDGYPVEGAHELAMSVLTKDLGLSEWSILIEVLEKEFCPRTERWAAPDICRETTFSTGPCLRALRPRRT
jgi:Domain of unknown function (DUF1896).